MKTFLEYSVLVVVEYSDILICGGILASTNNIWFLETPNLISLFSNQMEWHYVSDVVLCFGFGDGLLVPKELNVNPFSATIFRMLVARDTKVDVNELSVQFEFQAFRTSSLSRT